MVAPSPERSGETALDERLRRLRFSVVIPVFESADIVAATVHEVLGTFEGEGLQVEVVLVNDGSRDRSWEVISALARDDRRVIALNLLHNYGQHYANMAGLQECTGDYVVTMDDDGQNPADQAVVMLRAAVAGDHDVVFGQFEQKRARGYRRLGSKMIASINRRVFAQPRDLVVSNFRVLRRDVVDRICASRTAYPYITGQALMFSRDRANVVVRHEPRRGGGPSTYSFTRILRLVLTILFSYSVFPLRAAAMLGFAMSVISFLIGLFYLAVRVFGTSSVPGWTTLVVLTSFFNGIIIALLSMTGEYVVRTLNTVSTTRTYHVVERVGVRRTGAAG